MSKFLAALLIALFGVVPMTDHASAQSFPPKSLKIIVPWAPGGLSDIVCRQLQQPLSDVLGVPVVIENKTGASGQIGTEAIARSKADGTVIGTVGSSHATNTALFPKLPYDAVADFKPITILARSPNVIVVHPSTSYKSLADVIAAAKAAPGDLNYVSSGNGTAQHLGFEQIKLETGIDIQHIPYRGAGPALNDLAGGQVKLGFLNIAGALPHINAGTIRALGVSSPKRTALLPDVPTIAETVPGFDFVEYAALVAPAGLSDDFIEKLYQAIAKAARSSAYESAITKVGMELSLEQPAEYRALIARDIARIGDLVRKANIKIE
jgi:tripartite-type tricarboxylate transporter receptor subunit TctC